MPRLGVPVVVQRLFLTNVVVIILGRASGLAFMQLLQHAVRARGPTPLAADDTDPVSPVFFFDVPFADVPVVKADVTLAMRATVFGVKGMGNPHLPTLLASGHAFLVVTDGTDAPLAAARAIAARVPEERREEVYPALVNDDEDAHAALRTVLEDLAHKAAAS